MRNEKSPKFNVLYLLQTSKLSVALSIFFSILSTGVSVIASLKCADILKFIIALDYKQSIYSVFTIMVLFQISSALGLLMKRQENRAKQAAMFFYRNKVADKLRSRSSSIDQGNFISTLNNDSVQVDKALDSFFVICESITGAVLPFIGLFSIHYFVAAGAVVLFLLNMAVPKVLKKPAEKNEEKRSKNLELYLNETSDIIRGFDVWNLYNAKSRMEKKLCEYSEEFETERKKVNDKSLFFDSVAVLFSTFGQSVQYLFVVFLVSVGIVVPGAAFSVGDLLGKFFNSLVFFIGEVVKISGYNYIIDEKLSGDLEVDETLSDFNGFDIEVKSLEFGYTEKPVLKIPKLKFEYGKKYAIIGPSGSGKSTLSNILMKRELDYKGEVLFGGKNLKDLNEFCLFHHVGFMTQKPYVFNDTILNNITLGESYDTSLVKEAVEESRLEDFSDKLEYVLSNNGGNISGGQAQRIAIAREVIHDHEVMVFDEAVNALDQRLVREVVNILLEKKATIIFIAHNLDKDMLSEFDEVIDMSKVNECYGD